MKKLLLTTLLIAAIVHSPFAQTKAVPYSFKMPPLDKSPVDIAYFPVNYPVLKIEDKATEPLMARIIYSRPQKDDRQIFGDLVEYDKVWRLGANEATEIELFKDATINNKKLQKGRYTLYAIPTPAKWTIIFNKETDIWGAFKYNEKNDVMRVDVPVQKNTEVVDAFTMVFARSATGADLTIAWDDVLVTLPIAFKQ